MRCLGHLKLKCCHPPLSQEQLQKAAEHGSGAAVRTLLRRPDSARYAESRSPAGNTAFLTACFCGHLHCIISFLVVGCDRDATTATGETALHISALYGRRDAVAVLLAAGCDAGVRNWKGETAAQQRGGNTDAIRAAIKSAAPLPARRAVWGALELGAREAFLNEAANPKLRGPTPLPSSRPPSPPLGAEQARVHGIVNLMR